MAMNKECCWMAIGVFFRLMDVQRPRDAIHLNDLTKYRTIGQSYFVAGPDLHLLSRVIVAIDHRTGGFAGLFMEHLFYPLDKAETCNRARFVEQIFLRQIPQTVVLPPVRLLFAPMPIEQVCKSPAGPLFRRAIRCFWKIIAE